MTRGSSKLRHDASIYDYQPILLFDRFAWPERDSVLAAMRRIFRPLSARWRFGGAYLYWAQPNEGAGGGVVLYCGEAEDLVQRHEQHLSGPSDAGNKFADLSAYFSAHPEMVCGLALLVVPPAELPWLSPPDDEPFLDERVAKEAGEQLEGLLLRASINVSGAMPPFNDRNDASRKQHDDDVVRYLSLVRYLLDYDDASMDFWTCWIRAEEREVASKLGDLLEDCDATRRA
jgi:hypothetical protein